MEIERQALMEIKSSVYHLSKQHDYITGLKTL